MKANAVLAEYSEYTVANAIGCMERCREDFIVNLFTPLLKVMNEIAHQKRYVFQKIAEPQDSDVRYVVVVLDKTYTVTAAATAESNEITFNITPALMDDITTSTEITVTAGHVANLAFHKNAFALVTRPLALPKGLSSEQKAIVNYDGFGLRVIYDYNSQFKKDVISIDMLCGVKTLNPELACRLLG